LIVIKGITRRNLNRKLHRNSQNCPPSGLHTKNLATSSANLYSAGFERQCLLKICEQELRRECDGIFGRAVWLAKLGIGGLRGGCGVCGRANRIGDRTWKDGCETKKVYRLESQEITFSTPT